jgi:hypothetical protein
MFLLSIAAVVLMMANGGLALAQQGGNGQGGNGQGGTHVAPEINPGVIGGAMALLAGGVLILRARRRPA